MKAKLTVTIEEELIIRAKQYAQEKGISISELVETSLRFVTHRPEGSFSQRWRGKFQLAKSSFRRESR
jgi:hypothetical protein